jgi:hypothetical protein
MRPLPLIWKRLVKDGQTCNRCGDTLRNLEAAVGRLQQALLPLDIEPTLQIQAIGEAEFKAEPAESNRIWIAGKPMEAWLEARVGMSPCCSVCGDSDCRTLEVGNTTYEVVPQELILQAALLAASQLLAPASTAPACATSCCSNSPGGTAS